MHGIDNSPPVDEKPDLALVVADLRRIADLRAEDVPALLGALEQVRTALWAQMMRVPTPTPREPDVGDEILTVPEVARELRFTRGYLYEAVRRGDLAAVRKGKYVRIRRADLRAWLDGHSPQRLDAQPRRPDIAPHAPKRAGPTSLSNGIGRVSRRGHVRAAPVGEPTSGDP
ncbi:MAG: helix-turn-helix domain-containing protein [Candidatus Rokuibacteriota bacterium]